MGKFSYSCLLGKVLKIAFNLEKKKEKQKKSKKKAWDIYFQRVYLYTTNAEAMGKN